MREVSCKIGRDVPQKYIEVSFQQIYQKGTIYIFYNIFNRSNHRVITLLNIF